MNASKRTKEHYFNYIGSIQLPLEIIEMCPNSGPADSAISEMRKLPEVIAELSQIDPKQLRKELYEYGDWDNQELQDHEANLDRILWMTCLDIQESILDDDID